LKCDKKECDRLGVLKVRLLVDNEKCFEGRYCCKTHMLRCLSKLILPRYSKKRVQQILGTASLKLKKEAPLTAKERF